MGLFRNRQPLTPLVLEGKRQRLAVGSEYNAVAYAGRREGDAVLVELVAEANNPHDRNAVALVMDGRTAGYLGHSAASEYQAPTKRANARGIAVHVHGTIERVEEDLAVRVMLPGVDEFLAAIESSSVQR